MKQILFIAIFLATGLLFTNDAVAQSKTKCPPGKSFFKSKEKKGFLSSVFNKHKDSPKAKVFYQPVAVEEEVKEEKTAKVKDTKYRESKYKRNRRITARRARKNSKSVATTDCPRR